MSRIYPNSLEGCAGATGSENWKMVRTIWLPAGCLAVLGAVTVGKVENTCDSDILETSADGARLTGPKEPLAKADRLQITNLQPEASIEAASQPIKLVASDIPNSISRSDSSVHEHPRSQKSHSCLTARADRRSNRYR
jgi:hypothetical protein